jgi:ribose transport system permease protein
MIVSAGQMLVLVTGGFDLALGSVVALSSVVAALVMAATYAAGGDLSVLAIVSGVLAGLATGAVVGVFNGFCVAVLRVSPFMVTLGSLSIVSGVAFFLTAGTPIYGLPDEFTRGIGRAVWLNVPAPVFFAVAIVALIWVLQRRTVVGRHWYAIGSNENAARVSGIAVRRNLVLVYILSGVLAAVVGLLLTARIGSGQATLGSELMLQSIAAAMVAGVSLRGGIGRIETVALGALFLSLVTNSMNLLRIDSKAQTIVMGVLLVAAVLLDQVVRKTRP